MTGFLAPVHPADEVPHKPLPDGKHAYAVDFLVGEKVRIDDAQDIFGVVIAVSITQAVVYEVNWWSGRSLCSGWFQPHRLTRVQGAMI